MSIMVGKRKLEMKVSILGGVSPYTTAIKKEVIQNDYVFDI